MPTPREHISNILTSIGFRSAAPAQPQSAPAQTAAPRQRMSRRSIPVASFNRLTPADWKNLSTLEQTLTSNYVIRNRARELEKTNDFAERFLKECEANIPGPMGFTLQSNVRELKQVKQKDGTSAWVWVQDVLANTKIEESFAEFSKTVNYLVDGQESRASAERLLTRMWMRDGEAFVRLVPDAKVKFGTRLMILEAETVDELLNTVNKTNGNVIKMGVEIDQWRRPVAYYVRKQTTSSELYGTILSSGNHEVIPADQILHLFTKKYPNQTRGISELVQSMIRLKRLSDYEDAVLINAQISAAKMGFFSDKNPENPDELILGNGVTETDSEGNEYQSGDQSLDVSAGSMEDIGSKEFTAFTPEFPSAQHEMVVNTTTHAVTSGLGTDYASVTNDLGDTSYSSARVGLLDVRELWKVRQQKFIEKISEPVFSHWMQFAILAGALILPISKFEKFNKPVFIGRRWPWVDPLKDIMADALAVEYGFATRRQLLAERGLDIQEVNAELAQDHADAVNAGVMLKFHEASKAEPVDPNQEQDPPPTEDPKAKKKNRSEQEEMEERVLMQAAQILMSKKRNGHTIHQ